MLIGLHNIGLPKCTCVPAHTLVAKSRKSYQEPKGLPAHSVSCRCVFWHRYMTQQLPPTCRWAVLRPVVFLENLDSAKLNNPLKKGRVRFITKPDVVVKFVSIADVGRAACALLTDPDQYAGRKVDAAACAHSGVELARILSEVSGTPCTYSLGLPRWATWLLPPLWHMHAMTAFYEGGGFTADIATFRQMVPGAMDARAWFKAKGKWADGKPFETDRIRVS